MYSSFTMSRLCASCVLVNSIFSSSVLVKFTSVRRNLYLLRKTIEDLRLSLETDESLVAEMYKSGSKYSSSGATRGQQKGGSPIPVRTGLKWPNRRLGRFFSPSFGLEKAFEIVQDCARKCHRQDQCIEGNFPFWLGLLAVGLRGCTRTL